MPTNVIKTPSLVASLVLILVACLVACDGSGKVGGVGGGSLVSDGSTPYTNQRVNGPLQGEIWSASTGNRLNLNTGELRSLSEHSVYPSKDGREYAELIPEYRLDLTKRCGFTAPRLDAIIIRDSVSDHPKHYIELIGRLVGPVVFSPDGQTLAVLATQFGPCDDLSDAVVTLLTRDGEVIARGERIIGFDWMPDNRLAFMVNDNGVLNLVIENERHSLEGQIIASAPEFAGLGKRFRISPDGQQVLFELVSDLPPTLSTIDYREATVWQMNTDGSNLRQIADTSRLASYNEDGYDDARVNQPVWSPDSQHLLMTENFTSGAVTTFYGTETDTNFYIESSETTPIDLPDITYIMPAITEFVRLPPPAYSPIGVRPLLSSNQARQIGVLGINPLSRQSWTSEVEPSASSSGSFPNPNGRVNRGLSGDVYFKAGIFDSDFDAAIVKFDVETNVKSIIKLNSTIDGLDSDDQLGAFNVSQSKNRIAAFQYESSEREYLTVYDSSGKILSAFLLANSDYDFSEFGANLQISPISENLVAWSFYDFDKDRRGVVVADTQANNFYYVFDDRRYNDFSWFPNGDMLLVDGNKVYRAQANRTGFSAAQLLFEHTVHPTEVSVAPDGQRLVFRSVGHIFTIKLDGSELVKVTSPTTHYWADASWSPDGQSLLLFGRPSDLGERRSLSFVSADAMNMPLYEGFGQDGIMELGEGALFEDRNDTVYNRPVWR